MANGEGRGVLQAGLRFIQAAVLVFAALLVRQTLRLDLGLNLPEFIFLFPAVTLASWLFGLWPGLLATALATTLSAIWIYPPGRHFTITHLSDTATVFFFFTAGVLINLCFERFRRQQDRLLALATEEVAFETRAMLAVALSSMADAVLIVDKEGRFVDFNDAFARFYRFNNRMEFPACIEEFPAVLEMSLASGEPVPFSVLAALPSLHGGAVAEAEYNLLRKDTGETWTGSYTFAPIHDKTGGIAGSVVVARDITAQRQAADALRASEERYRTVFQTSQDAILLINMEDERVLDVNQAFIDFTGYSREEAIGKTTAELSLWEDQHDRENLIDALKRRLSVKDLQARFKRKSGEIFWGLMSSSPIEIEGTWCFLSVLRDISAAKLAEEEIKNLAFYDSLTGLANRRLLMEQLRRSIALSARTRRMGAVLFIDLDNFKNLNDTLGHQQGDLLLQEIARRLNAAVRETDTVSRLGGDEFVVMLEELSENPEDAAAEAESVAEKILAQLVVPFWINGHEWVSTCSIGITIFGDQRDDMSAVLRQADLAMYEAKSMGRNRARFFAPELQATVIARTSMEEELRQSIQRNEFVLYYQPQVEHGKVVGAEALLRWRHPRLGLVSPGNFIAVAEETRLILSLGQWILDTACAQLVSWASRPQSAGIVLAVNISAVQLSKPDFVGSVLGALNRSGANPLRLKLEITESMLLDDFEGVIAKMTALRAHGVRFALDDFGTGYSSLSYLKRLPLDELKIDRSFICDLLSDPASLAIAKAIIAISRAMNLPVIAEGVETEEHKSVLAELGCHLYQGYLFSPPLPVEKFEQLHSITTP